MFDRLPVHVLTGFLGVGKTTAVRDLLGRRADTERIAVIVNEYGDLGIDGALLSDCSTCTLKEIPGGCVCCTAMADLEASIEEMLNLVAPTRLLVEPTGLARPSEIVDLFRSVRFEPRFELRPVITMVDAKQDLAALYAEGGLFRDQIDGGDVLVLNRCDEATEEEVRRVEAFAATLSPPKLDVVRTSFGVLPDRVFDTPLPHGERRGSTLLASATLLPALAAVAPGSGSRDNGVEGYVGRGFFWEAERIFDSERLESLFADLSGSRAGLAGSLARAKGIFRTTAGWRVHEIAGGRSTIAPTPYRRDNRVDTILRHPEAADFERIGDRFEAALVPEGAPLLHLEDEKGLVRAYDPAALEKLAERIALVPAATEAPGAEGRAFRLADLIGASGLNGTEDWIWLISEGGHFGSGGPRAVLERGLVLLEAPFRYVLPEEAARGYEEEVDMCRDVWDLCTVRLARSPGSEPA